MNKLLIAFIAFALMSDGRRVQLPADVRIVQEDVPHVQTVASEVERNGDSSFIQVGWAANPSPHGLMPVASQASQVARTVSHTAHTPDVTARSSSVAMSDGLAISPAGGPSENKPNEGNWQTWLSKPKWLGLSFMSVAILPLLARRVPSLGARSTSPSMMTGKEEGGLVKFMKQFNNLFAVWLALAAVVGVQQPASFLWVKSSYFTALLGFLMFSVGITTTIDDFKACLNRPGAVAINFFSCYGIMPIVAYVLAKAIGADGAMLAGMVLVGAINGGQASNLCTLIAGGDVALSVLMTTSTTLGCIFMTPLICKLVLGSVVPVDAVGIVLSTLQVVLAPIVAGVGLNTLAPKLCAKAAKFSPTIGVLITVLLVGASVAQCSGPILGAGLPLQLACLGLHAFGGILGYLVTKVCGFDIKTCRTVAIETAMKSSAFSFVLASLHFGAFAVRVPSAVSVVWMAITGSALAVFWQGKPVDAKPTSS